MDASELLEGDYVIISPNDASDQTNDPAKTTLMTLPGELRNRIYHLYFEDHFAEKVNAQDRGPYFKGHNDVSVLKPILPILSASHTIRHEANSILWIDYIAKRHWDFGAKGDDDARFHSFIKAMRGITRSVNITYQKRTLNLYDLDDNLAWILVRSSYSDEQHEELKAERGLWKEEHGNYSYWFFYGKTIRAGPRDCLVEVKYVYQAPLHSWVRITGQLANLEWDQMFKQAYINTSFKK